MDALLQTKHFAPLLKTHMSFAGPHASAEETFLANKQEILHRSPTGSSLGSSYASQSSSTILTGEGRSLTSLLHAIHMK